MKKRSRKYLLVFLLCNGLAFLSLAQDVDQKNNAVKIGILPSKITVGYDRAIFPFLSGGLSVDGHFARFKGVSGNLYVRAYTHTFQRSGFLFELKGTYGYYNPICYTTEDSQGLHGEHHADITGISVTGMAGYRWLWDSGLLIEIGMGLRASNATFGPDDNYLKTHGVFGSSSHENVSDTYYNVGPGGPLEVMFNIGKSF